jgi:hypothetical protein
VTGSNKHTFCTTLAVHSGTICRPVRCPDNEYTLVNTPVYQNEYAVFYEVCGPFNYGWVDYTLEAGDRSPLETLLACDFLKRFVQK